MALDSCNIQSFPRSSTLVEANGHAVQAAPRSKMSSPSTKRSSNDKTSDKTNNKTVDAPSKMNGVHVNGVHGNVKPIPYVPIEPKPNSETPSSNGSGIRSSRTGECATCGRKNVLVSMPPMSRCVDQATCEETRKLMGLLRSNKPIPVTKRAIVCTQRHGVTYYLKTVYYKTRELQPGEIINAPVGNRVIEKTIGEALELVREKNEATKFPPDKANQLAAIWGAVAREV